ncbi:MAG: cation-translocating P-type ATPase [Lachnospiraceae bacterium]|nr:cation-translocating P-type ATPase [Lachnospiraceae bacterium]
MKEWYKEAGERVMLHMDSREDGLTTAQVKERLDEYGNNELVEGKKKSLLEVFLSQFCDLLVIILIIAAVISAISGNVESTIVIIAVLILNAILGTVQYSKAQKSLDSLKSLSAPCAKVRRNGVKMAVASKDIVPGDILELEAGDLVVADGRILHNYSLQVNESSLTGESTNVDKEDGVIMEEAALADRKNMVYSGSLVTYGRATVVVTETGMQTEMGKIARLMNDTKEKKTPLQVSLDQFSSKLAMVIMGICVVVFLLGIYRDMKIIDSLMFAVALAVAAIPEALGSIVTIVQAMGTQKMAQQNAIIKDLKAVESLGCVSVICSDKTGTLTQNKMTVQHVFADGKTITPKQLDAADPVVKELLFNAVLNNDSSIVDGVGIGDPTEFALLAMLDPEKWDVAKLRAEHPRLSELAFDSDRKLMSTLYQQGEQAVMFTKGALDVLLDRTVCISTNEGVRAITKEDKDAILKKNLEFSEQGLRVLAFAKREMKAGEELALDSEQELTFLGLISMIDPPREESAKAVTDAVTAGIRPIMITGDHKVTATAIAKQIGIFKEGDLAVVGPELDVMSEEELDEKITRISVYARVSPENKIRIVEAWQKRGNIVAMTGDGVNDAPALKKADIGVAMGITGTEVSKDAASMILSDDNFATIIKAVANGRNVYRNIKNAIGFLLSGNMAGIFAVLYTSLLALPVPFQPVHLLFINLLTDSLPALAIGMEPAEKNLLKQPPRDPKEGILTKAFLFRIGWQGALIAFCTMVSWYGGFRVNAATASTMAFATLTLARLFHGFNCRSAYSLKKIGFRKNWYSLGAFLAGVLLLAAVLLLPPLHHLFAIAPLTLKQYGMILGGALFPTLLIQIVRMFRGK